MPTSNLQLLGATLIAIVVACTAVGAGLGWLLGNATIGAFLGALGSVPLVALAVWRLVIRPFSEESRQRDYSNLTPLVDDDD